VVLQARDEQRASVNDLVQHLRALGRTRELVPLASVVSTEETGAASELRALRPHALGHDHRQPRAGYSLGEALDYMETWSRPAGPCRCRSTTTASRAS
jgi:hypothetical protein